jgi:integrase
MLMSVVQIHLSPPNLLEAVDSLGQRLFSCRFSVGCCTKVLHMTRDFLTSSRHGTVYYFRRRVPDDLRQQIGKPYLVRTLATSHRGTALVLARRYATKTDLLYEQLRAMKKSSDEELRFNYMFEIDLDDLGLPRKVTVNATADETEAVQAAIKTTLQNLPNSPSKVQKVTAPAIQVSEEDLLEHFFREGKGSGRWRNPETTRKHDYEPIWAKWVPHTAQHGMTLAAAKSYRAEVLASGASPETKHRNLYRIHAVVRYGVDHHGLDARMLVELKMPPSKGRGKNSRAKPYLPFSDGDLILLFHSPAYQQNAFKKPSHYWLPMLGLYTGARLEELAGLHLSAFTTVDDVPAITLSDEEVTDGGKNEYAPRQVPIHAELLKVGLLEYVQRLLVEGHVRLFPDLGQAARDGFGKRATTDFTEYRRSVGVGKDKGERSRKVFHSFRSTLAGKFYQYGIDGDLSRRLTGHAAIDVHQGTYLAAAAIPMRRARDAMHQISFGLNHPQFVETEAYLKSRKRKPHGQSASQRGEATSLDVEARLLRST